MAMFIKQFSRFVGPVTKSTYLSPTSILSNQNHFHRLILNKNLHCIVTKPSNLFINKTVFINRGAVCRNISLSQLCYAKSKDRGGKEKKKAKASKLDLRELSELLDVDSITSEMNQSVENMKAEFMKNLTLRTSFGSVEQLPVSFEGKEYELQELAQISRRSNMIVLNLAAFSTAIPSVLKTIQNSGLNINPQQEGATLYLPITKVTKEYRESLSKNARAIFIRHRDEIKETRNKTIKSLKKKNDVSEDTIRRVQAQVEALCEKYLKEAEMVLETKQNELIGSLN